MRDGRRSARPESSSVGSVPARGSDRTTRRPRWGRCRERPRRSTAVLQFRRPFPDHAGRALVLSLAIRGHKPARAEHRERHRARNWIRSISSSEISSCSRLWSWVVRVDPRPAMRAASSRSPPFRSYSVISLHRKLCAQISGTTFRQMRQARRFPMASMTWVAHRSQLADQILPRRDSRLVIH